MTVVVIGSSGGGAATLGHTDPVDLLKVIHKELGRIQHQEAATVDESIVGTRCHGICFALFVSLHGGKGMDSVDPDQDTATLWTVGIDHEKNKMTSRQATSTKQENKSRTKKASLNDNSDSLQVTAYYTGLLREVNKIYKDLDQTILAPSILDSSSDDNGKRIRPPIKGLICISCEPRDINYASISAAARRGIPISGSGGTSLSTASVMHNGMTLVGNSGGSVATTTYTRAVSYCQALASFWGDTYSPFFESKNENRGSKQVVKPHIRSILDACLPPFLAVCLACRFLELMQQHNITLPIDKAFVPSFSGRNDDGICWIDILLTQLQFLALPTVCAVVTATSYAPEHGSAAVMAACVASMGCYGSILAGLLSGWMVSWLLTLNLITCIRLRIPATMTNIFVAGFVGTGLATFMMGSGATFLLGQLTEYLRIIVRSPTPITFGGAWDGTGFGFILGCVFCYGSKVGWYHSVFLPVILIEMEHGEASFWGSIDECVLVMVSAGICAANILTTSSSSQKTNINSSSNDVCRRGLLINLLCGDFIEAAYPFMERSKIVNIAGYMASGLATELLYSYGPNYTMSSAYLPVFVSLLLAKEWKSLGHAMLVAFTSSCLGMLLSNFLYRHQEGEKEHENNIITRNEPVDSKKCN